VCAPMQEHARGGATAPAALRFRIRNIVVRVIGISTLFGLGACGESQPPITAQPMGIEDVRREFINLPLCGKPDTGPLAGKTMCTIHFADGTATLAGDGIVARMVWETQGRGLCRRDVRDAPADERCVTYDRLSNGHYRNSDGVEFCLGPCPEPPRGGLFRFMGWS
jgi:hypothetical protein